MEHTLRLRKGAWTSEEDDRLRICIRKYGEGQWHRIPLRAGLNRCRKSCRLRWLNYLKPNIKRGDFAVDEIDLIIRLHKLLGNRWSLIAGRLPGRTANDVKNYWNTHLKKQFMCSNKEIKTPPKITINNILKPRPRTFSNKYFFWSDYPNDIAVDPTQISPIIPLPPESDHNNESSSLWWKNLLDISSGDDQMQQLNKNDAINQTVAQQTETNARYGSVDQVTCYAQDKSFWSDFCLDDFGFWDFLDAPHEDHVSISTEKF